MQIDGELRGAMRIPFGNLNVLTGRIYGDRKARFEDGERIQTTYITVEYGDDVFKTRNSVYKVASWYGEEVHEGDTEDQSLTIDQHLLSILAEECTEVGQRVSKALRFGLSEVQPGQGLTNAQRIAMECIDIIAVMELCEDRKLISIDYSASTINKKKEKVRSFMRYAKEIGAVTGEVDF